ncbi:hypothetical protein HDV02_006554 [Globomyces sp. JEL0801]|nr:hypothetical protein HDV02_006554 [Globomyces sp. JEL0801]
MQINKSNVSVIKKSKNSKRITPHSVIEKRRRESINLCLDTLKSIIPDCAIRGALPRLTVLQTTIDYIVELQSLISEQENSEISQPKAEECLYEVQYAQNFVVEDSLPVVSKIVSDKMSLAHLLN